MLAEPSESTSATLADRLKKLAWHRAAAYVIAALLTSLILSGATFGLSPLPLLYAWTLRVSSMAWLLLPALFCIWPGRTGLVLMAISLLGLEAGLVWSEASAQVSLEQTRPLLWSELAFRFNDGSAWAVLKDSLLTLPFLLLTGTLFIGTPLLSQWLATRPMRLWLPSSLAVLTLALGAGTLLAALGDALNPQLVARCYQASLTPWSRYHQRRVPSDKTLDLQAARDQRNRPPSPFWSSGPAKPLAQLSSRYPNRSIILIILESHRASDVVGFGEGAYGHRDASPFLARMGKENVRLVNYIAPDLSTGSALWSLFTGLPNPSLPYTVVMSSPEGSRLGRLPDFINLGYTVEWLCGAPAQMDNWSSMLGAAGARWWIELDETRDLDRTYWTPFGMPDEQLYRIALERYRAGLEQGQPQFFGLLATSNHYPYSFPDTVGDTPLPRNHLGGMRYADHCLERFVAELRKLPQKEQPILLITSDTSNLSGLNEAQPPRGWGLEAVRIPGVLALPDGAFAGRTYEGVFCHEDTLDLLYFLVTPAPEKLQRFHSIHRSAAVSRSGFMYVSRNSVLLDRGGKLELFNIEKNWDLNSNGSTKEAGLLKAAHAQHRKETELLWRKRP